MALGNATTIVGNLTRDPELKFTSNGRAVCQLGVAVSRRYQVNGEWQEQTSYLTVVAWGQLGENAAATLEKGSRVIVSGSLEQRSYETKEGEKRSVVEIKADNIGPDLSYATAAVTKNPKQDNGQGSAPARKSSSGSSSFDIPANDSFDDEPF
jgi:single-strand DNA-binding protein